MEKQRKNIAQHSRGIRRPLDTDNIIKMTRIRPVQFERDEASCKQTWGFPDLHASARPSLPSTSSDDRYPFPVRAELHATGRYLCLEVDVMQDDSSSEVCKDRSAGNVDADENCPIWAQCNAGDVLAILKRECVRLVAVKWRGQNI